jgi:hypothetical protein
MQRRVIGKNISILTAYGLVKLRCEEINYLKCVAIGNQKIIVRRT